jgi:choline dehydrogenase
MIYMRGQAHDYDHWAELTGNPEWTWNNSLKDFIAHEDLYKLDANHRGTPSGIAASIAKVHGRGGEWRVEKRLCRVKDNGPIRLLR